MSSLPDFVPFWAAAPVGPLTALPSHPAAAPGLTWSSATALGLTALLAGAINSVAGGGSFLTFPALMFCGVSPIRANATDRGAVVSFRLAE